MSCPKTPYIIQEYFSDDLAPLAREELDRHLGDCAYCRGELESMLSQQMRLSSWEEQRVPHWDRGLELFRREHRAERPQGIFSRLQWLPTAASFVMLCVLLLNVNVTSDESGFSISFGSSVSGNLNSRLAAFEQEQASTLEALAVRMEERQDSNNVRLLQAVLEQTQQTTAANLDQLFTYFEQQRLLDLQDMRVGYQQLVDQDFETIRSLQQLASYVSYEEFSQ